jgi:hypothetical protein
MAHKVYTKEEFLKIVAMAIMSTSDGDKTGVFLIEEYLKKESIVFSKQELRTVMDSLITSKIISYEDENIRYDTIKLPYVVVMGKIPGD